MCDTGDTPFHFGWTGQKCSFVLFCWRTKVRLSTAPPGGSKRHLHIRIDTSARDKNEGSLFAVIKVGEEEDNSTSSLSRLARHTIGVLRWNMLTKVCDLEHSHGGFYCPPSLTAALPAALPPQWNVPMCEKSKFNPKWKVVLFYSLYWNQISGESSPDGDLFFLFFLPHSIRSLPFWSSLYEFFLSDSPAEGWDIASLEPEQKEQLDIFQSPSSNKKWANTAKTANS